jgi:hypothetical protein
VADTSDWVYSLSTPVKLIKDETQSVAASRPINTNTISSAGTNEVHGSSGLLLNSVCQASVFPEIWIILPCTVKVLSVRLIICIKIV